MTSDKYVKEQLGPVGSVRAFPELSLRSREGLG